MTERELQAAYQAWVDSWDLHGNDTQLAFEAGARFAATAACAMLTPTLDLEAACLMCPFCLADWPVEYSHGECPVIHVRPASLWRNPSADHVQCQAARLRAMAEGWPFNPVIAAERG